MKRSSRPVSGVNPYRQAPKVIDQGLGGAPNPGGNDDDVTDNTSSSVSKTKKPFDQKTNRFEDPSLYTQKEEVLEQCPLEEESQETTETTSDSEKSSTDEPSEKQGFIYEQDKAGIDELPDSSEYIYTLETKTAKKALKKVWKNREARNEVLAGLAKMDRGELLPRNEKNFQSFKELKEIKLQDTRMLVKPGQKGAPDEIVVIFMKNDMAKVEKNLKKVFK